MIANENQNFSLARKRLNKQILDYIQTSIPLNRREKTIFLIFFSLDFFSLLILDYNFYTDSYIRILIDSYRIYFYEPRSETNAFRVY